MLGLDKDLDQPTAGYWGLAIAPERDGYGGYNQNVEEIQPVIASSDVTGQSFAPVLTVIQPDATKPLNTATSTNDVITAVGNVAATVIDAIKGNTQPIVATNNNTPTTDKGKKTATILWIVGGVVVVATLLYLAFKPRN